MVIFARRFLISPRSPRAPRENTFTCFTFAIAIGLCVSLAGQATQVGDECKTIQACAAMGNAALQRGDVAGALLSFRSQVQLTDDVDDLAVRADAFDNMTAAFLAKQDFIRARSWARLAASFAPSDGRAKANLKQIDARMKSSRWSTPVSGLYVEYAGYAWWNSLKVSEPDQGKIKLELEAFRLTSGWLRAGPASFGDVDGIATMIDPRRAIYQVIDKEDYASNCRLVMDFSGDAVSVKQQDLCGFGHNVTAAGTWDRICAGKGADCEPPSKPIGPF